MLSSSSGAATATSSSPTAILQAGPTTLHVPYATPLTSRWPTSSAVPHLQRIWPLGICGQYLLQGSPISGALPSVCRSAPTADQLQLPFSLASIPAFGPLPLAAPAGPLHIHYPPPRIISSVFRRSTSQTATQQQQQIFIYNPGCGDGSPTVEKKISLLAQIPVLRL